MNSDILLMSETWIKLRDTFKSNDFDHHHLVSDLSRRRPSGVSIYIKHHLKALVESAEMFPNQDLGIHVLVANFKTKVCASVLYAKPGSSDDDITDVIDESLTTSSVLSSVLSIHSVKTCGLYDSVFSDHLPSIRSSPLGKNKTSYGRFTRRQRFNAKVWAWNFAAQIDWEGDDYGYPM
ncbi:ATP-dependent DNA helicase [Caerostris extrusa]|uniref:ATP-dependent DNA helicase n=1 Tax=Caerostris extrusa TaxID=172846 RepID=A0AAV4PBJ3_CAEEX|nr:ATP-dependent DNA helicase [Caerostris extrusa]